MLRQSLFTVVAAVLLLLLVSSASATSLDPFEDPLQNSNPRAGNNGPSSQIFSPVHSLRRELQYDDDDATEDERNAVQKVMFLRGTAVNSARKKGKLSPILNDVNRLTNLSSNLSSGP